MMTTRLRHRRQILARLAPLAAEAAIAWMFLTVGVNFFLHPDAILRSPLGQHVPVFAEIWNGLYIVGGSLALLGLTARLARPEVVGSVLLVTGLTMNALALAVLEPADLRPAAYLAAAAACAVRARRLVTA